jgi:hypothetical protein
MVGRRGDDQVVVKAEVEEPEQSADGGAGPSLAVSGGVGDWGNGGDDGYGEDEGDGSDEGDGLGDGAGSTNGDEGQGQGTEAELLKRTTKKKSKGVSAGAADPARGKADCRIL